jgi:sugar lactone lactonase YvrE
VVSGCFSSKGGGGGGGAGGDGGGSAPPFTNGVSTLAGAADAAYVDGDRDVGRFANPVNVAYGPDGKIYVADFDNGKVRVVDGTGTSSTVVAQQGFARPFGLAFSGTTLYATTDANGSGQHTPAKSGSLWKIDVSAGVATELADSIGMPRNIGVLANGLLVVSDYENHVIETFNPTTKQLVVLAGIFGTAGSVNACGTMAGLNTPYGLAVRSDGKVVFVEQGNNDVRVIDPTTGCVTAFAGTGQAGFADGALATAQLSAPESIAIDGAGNLFIADSGNYRVREIANGMISTVAGNGTPGYVDNDNDLSAELFGLEGITAKPDGTMVYVADGTRGNSVPYNRIREVKLP